MDDYGNKFAVEPIGTGSVLVGFPPGTEISGAEAFLLAAWLIAVAEQIPHDESFNHVLKEVRKELKHGRSKA